MTETEWQLCDAERSLLLIPVLSHLLIHPSYPMPGPLLLPLFPLLIALEGI